MVKGRGMKQILFRKTLTALLFLLFFNSLIVFAHEPHDDIFQVEISPTYSEDKTVFIIVRNCVFKSENGGEKWIRLVKGLDYKGFPCALAISPQTKKVLYLSSSGDGVYKSEDSGLSWKKVNNGLKTLDIDLLVISPHSAESVIAAGEEGGLYKTDNGGREWYQLMPSDKKINAIQFLPGEGKILAGDSKGRLYIYQDSGKKWKEKFDFKYYGAINVIALSPEFSKEDTFFVGTEKGGVFITTDRGFSFRQTDGVAGFMGTRNIRDIKFLPHKDKKRFDIIVSTWHKGVFISTNDGRSWRNFSKGLTRNLQAERPESLTLAEGSPPRRPHFSELRVSDNFSKDKTIFLAGFDGLFKSKDGGRIWRQTDTFSGVIAGVAISPDYKNDSTIAVATYTDGAYISSDAGKRWSKVSKDLRYIRDKIHYFKVGPPERHIEIKWLRLFDVAFSPNYAIDETIYFTPLWQLTKLLRCTPKDCLKTSFSDSAAAIGFSPYFTQNNTLYLATQKGKIWVSEDKGKVFKNIGETIRVNKHSSICFTVSPNFLNDNTLYYTNYYRGLYKSTDGGYSWQNIATGSLLGKRSNMQVAISSDYKNDRTIFVGTDEGVYISEDAGKSWLKPESPLEIKKGLVEAVAISPDYRSDQTVLVSVRGEGLFKSEDRGRNFKHIGNDYISLSRVNLPSASMPIQFSPNYAQDQTIYGYGAAGAQIFKSTDGGKTWQIILIPKLKNTILDSFYDKCLIIRKLAKPILYKVRRRLLSKRFWATVIFIIFFIFVIFRVFKK